MTDATANSSTPARSSTHALERFDALDLSPRPGAAARPRTIWSHARTEALLLVRNGEQLLLALVIPMAVLVGARLFDRAGAIAYREVAPSVLALAIFSTAFTATAIATGFERRQGVLERLASTPLGRTGLILGKALAVCLVIVGQLVVLGALALALGWRIEAGALQWVVVLFTSALSVVTFVGLALVLAGTLRAEATLALANLLHLVVAAGGALLIGVDHYPRWVGTVLAFLPSAALGEAWRATSFSHVTLFSLPIALVWAVASALLARKVFRWTS